MINNKDASISEMVEALKKKPFARIKWNGFESSGVVTGVYKQGRRVRIENNSIRYALVWPERLNEAVHIFTD